jgi:hypothetical protein
VQKARAQKPVAQKPRKKQQQVVQKKRTNRDTLVGREDSPPPENNNDFLTKALIFGTGVAVGGVLNK